MTNKIKKITSIFLAALLIFSSCGSLLILKFQQQFNYFKVERQLINAQHLVVLTLLNTAYEKSKIEKDEMLLNGKMYDVKQIIYKGDSVICHCIADEKEDGIIASYFLVQKNKSHADDNNQHVLKLFLLIYLQTKQLLLQPYAENIKLSFTTNSCFFKPAVIHIESPPPKA